MNDDKLQMFIQRYKDNQTPWDTGIIPPELVAIVEELPTGKALDLGCGTGTIMRHLLLQGWQVDGLDFVPQAVAEVQRKLIDFPDNQFSVFCHDVTQLERCTGLRKPYDLVIDVGCGHGVDADKQPKYAQDVAALLKDGGIYMLYAIQPTDARPHGLTPDDVRRLFTPYFDIVWQAHNSDTSVGLPSGWYRLVKRQ